MQNQHEQYENARKRVKQKKRLYFHFVVFVLGSIILTVLNKALHIGEDFITNWYIIVITIWTFLFLLHIVNVFITNRFFGKEWERIQTEKILAKHDKKVAKLEKTVLKEHHIQEEITSRKQDQQVITIIAAAAENNELGKDNKLIWHLSNDLKRFKKLTSGHHIIMGRKTFESFPKALPNRTNVIITRDTNYQAENAVVVHSLKEALTVAKDDSQPFIIGGGEIYQQSLSIADRIELTRVHHSFEADTFFPELDLNIWREIAREDCYKDEKHNYDYSFITYEK
ncbi:dihydrofolate reductase [Pseudofulvibacter geojedonensis]|uniref:dihydrofolate reductase n=1 Tax=Pseudofulvibacter geojedonensis TaxID=1123758 RepID=A0ABW3I619_9FLAO